MKLVMLESPFAGRNNIPHPTLPGAMISPKTDELQNIDFALECAKDCIDRGEAPFASHLFYTRFLDDSNAMERALGIQCGLEWGARADYHVFYTDRGWSRGMLAALEHCLKEGRFFRIRGLREPAKIPPYYEANSATRIELAMEN